MNMNTQDNLGVVVDVSRNIVKTSYTGTIRAADMSRYEIEIERALQLVHPGFTLLTDFTELTSMELGCEPFMRRTMDMVRTAGVALVVRIIPDPSKDIGLGIMSLFHYPHGLKIVTTESRDEAAKILK
jgi:hypothetical protein